MEKCHKQMSYSGPPSSRVVAAGPAVVSAGFALRADKDAGNVNCCCVDPPGCVGPCVGFGDRVPTCTVDAGATLLTSALWNLDVSTAPPPGVLRAGFLSAADSVDWLLAAFSADCVGTRVGRSTRYATFRSIARRREDGTTERIVTRASSLSRSRLANCPRTAATKMSRAVGSVRRFAPSATPSSFISRSIQKRPKGAEEGGTLHAMLDTDVGWLRSACPTGQGTQTSHTSLLFVPYVPNGQRLQTVFCVWSPPLRHAIATCSSSSHVPHVAHWTVTSPLAHPPERYSVGRHVLHDPHCLLDVGVGARICVSKGRQMSRSAHVRSDVAVGAAD